MAGFRTAANVALVWAAVLASFVRHASVDAAALGKRRHERPQERSIKIKNRSGTRIDALWINRSKNPNTFHSNSNDEGTPYGGDQHINSFIGHEFEIRELPSKKTGKCKFDTCRKTQIQVNEQEDQVITVDKNFVATHTDRWKEAQLEAKELVSECRAKIFANDQGVIDESSVTDESIDALSECVEAALDSTLAKKQEEHDFQSDLRSTMAEKFVPYACTTPDLDMSQEVINQTWKYTDHTAYQNRQKVYQLKIYHERPYSKILTVDDFATETECDALMKASILPVTEDPHASKILWKDVVNNNDLKKLVNRIYRMAEAAMDWRGLTIDAVSSIPGNDYAWQLDSYVQPTHGDEDKEACPPYSPFCNLPDTKKTTVIDPKERTRVFLFCEKNPKNNGGIHFPQAAVHVHPKFGRLVWANIQARSVEDGEVVADGFVQDYHFCANHTIYTHRILDPDNGSIEA